MGIVNVFSTAKIQELLASLSSTYAAPTGTDDRLQVAGVDVTPAQVGAATAAQGAKADFVHEATPIMTNFVTNGDFSDGITAWSVYSSATASTSSGACVLTASENVQYMSYQLPSLTTAGRQYYFSMTAKQSAVAPVTSPRVYLGITKYGSNQQIVRWDNNTSQQRVSLVSTATIAGSYLSLYSYVDVGQTVTYDNVLLIDLTAAFGEGNEPTKAEMDAMLDSLGGWFDGSKVAPWYATYRLFEGAKNLVTNGDFSNGIVGWSPSGYGPIAATNNEVTYTVTTPSSASRIEQTTDLAIVGRQYYLRGAIFPKYTTITYLQIGNASSGSVALTPNTWNDISAVVTATANSRFRFYHRTDSGGYAVGDTFKYRRLLAIDLTTTFGAGLEPTKTEMDVLLSRYPNSWFGGTVNDLTRWYDPLNRVGRGSPYNVIAPRQKGETWTDLDQTNGARKWVATGTTATSWVVTDGDTGWRTVSSWDAYGIVAGDALPANFAPTASTAGHVQYRRILNRVYWRARGATISGSVSFTYPTGFSCNGLYERQFVFSNVLWDALRVVVGDSLAISFAAPPKSLDAAFYAVSSYSTSAPWPTTLPGTPA